MPRIRDEREGAAVHRKAGISGRVQLLSYFIEERMSDEPAGRDAALKKEP